MPYIQRDRTRFPLAAGDTCVGAAADAAVRVPEAESGAEAIVHVGVDQHASIRRLGREGAVRVNGVPLGCEPIPLLHGDRIEVGGCELRFGDEGRAGETQFVRAPSFPDRLRAVVPDRPTAATGGRLVSLVDGREYLVTGPGLSIGRDAVCDVVVPMAEVSRRHAEIVPGKRGYVVRDLSANGVVVNGERVVQSRRLGRGDVLRVGGEEFRFHADSAPHVDGAAGERPALATLEVTSTGRLAGQRFDLRALAVSIGSGKHNDVVLAEEGVSDGHAVLRKHEAGWCVIDSSSTNGTFVNGRRVHGEKLLAGASSLRFGSVTATFRPADAAGPAADARAPAPVRTARPVARDGPDGARTWRMTAWLMALMLLGAATFFILQSR